MEDSTRSLAPLFTWRSAICESGLKPTTRHVLLALSLYMNQRGGSAYPGSARLAHDTGLHLGTVKTALQDAVTEGYLAVLKRGGSPVGGKRLATEYAACAPGHGPTDRVWTDRGQTTTGSSDSADRVSSVQLPVVQDYPISSLNSSENSGGCAQVPSACVRCHGALSFWDGQKQRECDPHVFNDDEKTTPPWIEQGLSYRDWAKNQPPESAEG